MNTKIVSFQNNEYSLSVTETKDNKYALVFHDLSKIEPDVRYIMNNLDEALNAFREYVADLKGENEYEC